MPRDIFDPVDEPNKRDEEFTPDGDRHWDNYKFYDKLKRTSKAILACGGFTPPEVVGVCEIENRRVLEQLIYATNGRQGPKPVSRMDGGSSWLS